MERPSNAPPLLDRLSVPRPRRDQHGSPDGLAVIPDFHREVQNCIHYQSVTAQNLFLCVVASAFLGVLAAVVICRLSGLAVTTRTKSI